MTPEQFRALMGMLEAHRLQIKLVALQIGMGAIDSESPVGQEIMQKMETLMGQSDGLVRESFDFADAELHTSRGPNILHRL